MAFCFGTWVVTNNCRDDAAYSPHLICFDVRCQASPFPSVATGAKSGGIAYCRTPCHSGAKQRKSKTKRSAAQPLVGSKRAPRAVSLNRSGCVGNLFVGADGTCSSARVQSANTTMTEQTGEIYEGACTHATRNIVPSSWTGAAVEPALSLLSTPHNKKKQSGPSDFSMEAPQRQPAVHLRSCAGPPITGSRHSSGNRPTALQLRPSRAASV